MAKLHERFPFELVITVGDNIYGGTAAAGLRQEVRGAVQGAAQTRREVLRVARQPRLARAAAHYKLFNMDGKLYYTFKAPKRTSGSSRSTAPTWIRSSSAWIEDELKKSGEKWKIPYFHHPLYSSGERHGSQLTTLRKVLEPLFVKYNVSVVFTGHDHFYERIKPQNGIVHFVVGSGGQLRRGNIDARDRR